MPLVPARPPPRADETADDAADAADVTLPEPTVVVPLAAVAVTVPEALPDDESETAATRVDQPCTSTNRVSSMVKYLHEQKLLPTLMICDVSTPLGHDSVEQSRTPLPKSIFVHRQVMLLLGQPKLAALPNMFVMHVFYIIVSGSSSSFLFSYDGRRQVKHTPQSGRPCRELRSWATERPAKSATAAIMYCIVDVYGYVGQKRGDCITSSID